MTKKHGFISILSNMKTVLIFFLLGVFLFIYFFFSTFMYFICVIVIKICSQFSFLLLSAVIHLPYKEPWLLIGLSADLLIL